MKIIGIITINTTQPGLAVELFDWSVAECLEPTACSC